MWGKKDEKRIRWGECQIVVPLTAQKDSKMSVDWIIQEKTYGITGGIMVG